MRAKRQLLLRDVSEFTKRKRHSIAYFGSGSRTPSSLLHALRLSLNRHNSSSMSCMEDKKSSYFVDSSATPKVIQMAGLETKILTGLSGEKMMMALNVTSPHCTVPFHSHHHEQVGMVYSGKAKLRIGNEERTVHKVISTVFHQTFDTATLA